MDRPFNIYYDGDEGVDLSSGCSKCLYEWVVFSDFFVVGGVWKYVVTISEFNELYDIWWGWR
jgi:hypothetical protein